MIHDVLPAKRKERHLKSDLVNPHFVTTNYFTIQKNIVNTEDGFI